MRRFYSTSDVAAMFGVSDNRVLRAIKRGAIEPHGQIGAGGGYCFTRDQIEEWRRSGLPVVPAKRVPAVDNLTTGWRRFAWSGVMQRYNTHKASEW